VGVNTAKGAAVQAGGNGASWGIGWGDGGAEGSLVFAISFRLFQQKVSCNLAELFSIFTGYLGNCVINIFAVNVRFQLGEHKHGR